MTFVELIQRVASLVGIPRPTTAVGASDKSIVQLVELANSLGRQLVKEFDWQALSKVGTITTTGTADYDLPADWVRQIPGTEWDSTQRWAVVGSLTPQEWQYLKNGYPTSGPAIRFRVSGGQFHLTPTPASGRTLNYEYVSGRWVRDSSGTPKAGFTADEDTFVFDCELMIAGLRLKWREAKGLDSVIAAGEFAKLLALTKAQDRPARTLSLAPRYSEGLITGNNLPDSGYP